MLRIKLTITLDTFLLLVVLTLSLSAKKTDFVGWQLIAGLAATYMFLIVSFILFSRITITTSSVWPFLLSDFRRRSMLAGDAIIASIFGLLGLSLIRLGTGDQGVGIYTGLVFLFGPVSLVTVFIPLGLQAEAVRTRGYLAKRHQVWLLAIATVPLIWLFLIIQLPDSLLRNVLGVSVGLILSNAVPFGIATALGLAHEVLNLFMRAHRKFTELAGIRLTVSIISIALITILVSRNFGLKEIIWALAISNFIGVLLSAKTLLNTKNLGRQEISDSRVIKDVF